MTHRQQNQPERNHQLQTHINDRNHHMRYLQLICHQLVNVLTMSLTDILMQHHAMYNSQHTIHSINSQQQDISKVPRQQNQLAQSKQDNKCNPHTAYITGKALRFLTEIKEIKNQHTHQYHYQKAVLHKT